MAVTYVGIGTAGNGSVSVTPGLAAGWAAGDLAVLSIVSAETDGAVPEVTPTGGPWTLAGTEIGGGGTFAAGTGDRRLTWYTRTLATGDGSPTVTLPSTTGVCIAANVIVLRKAATEAWSVMTPEFGAETTSGTSLSQALTAIPSRLTTGAFLVAGYGLALGNSNGLSAEGIAATGATIGTVTERSDQGTSSGYQARLGLATATVTAGTATGAPVLTATLQLASTAEVGMLVVLATTSSISAREATSGEVLRRNTLTNPGAEVSATTGWSTFHTAGTPSFDTVDVFEEGLGQAPGASAGRRAFRVTGAATNTNSLGIYQTLGLQVPIGVDMTASFDLYLPAGHAVDEVRVGWATSAGSITQHAVCTPAPAAGWQRYTSVRTVATAALGRVYLYTQDLAGARGADTVYIDNAMLSTTAEAADGYFDGDVPVEGYVTAWDGTAQLSESVLYAQAEPPRVGVTLTNWGTDSPTTVYRVHEDGSRVPVRGGSVVPSGGAAFVWDYEFPTGQDVYYVADDSGTERTTALIDEVILRRNGVRNPCLISATTDWGHVANGVGTLVGNRVDGSNSDGPVVSGVRRDYYRATWSAVTTGAVSNTGIYVGSSGSTYVEASPGPWTGSFYWRCNVPDRTMRVVATFYDSGGVQIGSGHYGTSALSSGRWMRSSLTTTAPAGTARAVARLYGEGGAVWANGDTIDATAALVEDNKSAAGAYFDGDTPGIGYRWQGTANLSWSEQYATDLPTPLRVADGRAWLRSPGLPGLDLTCRVGAVPTRTHPRPVTLLAPMGRRTLVPQAGARQAPQYTLELVTLTDEEAQALIEYAEGTPIAYLLFPGSRLHGTYVSLGDLAERPNPKVGAEEVRWQATAVEVSRPAGGIAYDPNASWQAILSTSSSWEAVKNTYPSWLDVLRGPVEV